jgi:hypothetical protein
LAAAGAECFVVAGKDKVADIMAPRAFVPTRALVATYRQPDPLVKEWHLMLEDGRSDVEDIDDLGPPDEDVAPSVVRSLDDKALDGGLVRLAEFLVTNCRERPHAPVFLFVGMHRLDLVGHRTPRDAMADDLASVDEAVAELVQWFRGTFESHRVVVTADHGVRAVERCIVHFDGARPDGIGSCPGGLLDVRGDEIRAGTSPLLGPRDDGYIMDGGTVRAWNPPERLERVQSAVDGLACASPFLQSAIGQPHWGHFFAEANANVALCKPHWLGVIDLASNTVSKPVVAEHGTRHADDRTVPWWGCPNGPIVGHQALRDDALSFFVARRA